MFDLEKKYQLSQFPIKEERNFDFLFSLSNNNGYFINPIKKNLNLFVESDHHFFN